MDRTPVDIIVHHGKIYIVDSGFRTVEAMAIKDGKIIALGNNNDILLKYKADEPIDAKGYPVFPGFIDAHAHFVGYAKSLFQVDLYDCKTWGEALARVKQFADKNPNEKWILGRGWDQNKFPGQAYPDNEELSKLFPDKPVLLKRVDGHAAIANDCALNMAHVAATTKVEGGSVEMKGSKPSGVLIDNAVELVSNLIPQNTLADYEKWLTQAQINCFESGLTTVTDCGLMYYDISNLDSLQKKGTIKMRVYAMLTDSAVNLDKYLEKGPYKTEYLYVKGVKAYADGALGSRGACLKQPYADQPGHTGFLLSNYAHFDSLAARLAKTDFQLCTHAIGDSGNKVILDIYKKYLGGKNDKRWRIEHAQVVDPADIHYFADFNVVPSVQPTHATSDAPWATARLGENRMKGAYAYKTLLAQNGWMPLGTDFPVEGIQPVKTFISAVFRTDISGNPKNGFRKEEALTREQAIRGMTIWAAKANCMEKEIGSLEIGKRADFVILNIDPMTATEEQAQQIKPLTTFIGGSRVFGL